MEQEVNKKINLMTLRRRYKNPHDVYNELRAHDSIYFDTSSHSWLVTGYKAITTILGDARFSARLDPNFLGLMPSSVTRQITFMDGEAHQKAQNVILRSLASISRKMSEHIHRFACTSLSAMHAKGEMDLVTDFASSLSLLTIAHVLGIPLDNREELLQLEKWSDTFGDVTSGYFRSDMKDIDRLENYFRHLVKEKIRAPADDLISAIFMEKAVFPEEDDVVANCMTLFGAGRFTTKKLIGNGIPLLLPHWEALQSAYQKEPDALPKLLSEELLRLVTPTRHLIRQASDNVDLSLQFPGKHFIRQGEKVLLFLEAGNSDPTVFTSPEQCDPYRRPNNHIAFGYGRHQCPGAVIARLEIQIALEVLLSFANLQPKSDAIPVWNPNPNLGGFSSYPVLFKA